VSFVDPFAALAIGGAALATLTILYLMRRQRVRVVVPSILLWTKAGHARAYSASFRKLRRLLSWLINAVAIALLALAFGRPLLAKGAGGTGARVVVLDASASMQTHDPDASDTRFAQALRIARQITDHATPDSPVGVILAGAHARILAPLEDDPAALARALEQAAPEDGPCALGEALDLARGLARAVPPAQVVLLSDAGQPTGRRAASASDVPLELVRVGTPRPNLGITTFAIAPTPGTDSDFDAVARVYDDGPDARTAQLLVTLDGHPIDTRPLSLQAGAEQVLSWRLDGRELFPQGHPQGGVLEVRLRPTGSDLEDALPVDDQAYAVIPPLQPIKVFLRPGPNDFFLKQALAAAGGEVVMVPRAGDADVTIVHDNGPAPSGPALVFGDAPVGLPFIPGVAKPLTDTPSVKGWAEKSPIMAGVTLTDLHVNRTRAIPTPLPPGWESIADSPDGPLIVRGETSQGTRLVYFGFDPEDSDLPLRVAFPLLVANSLSWLRGEAPRASAAPVAPGDPLPVPALLETAAQSSGSPLTLTLPDGTTQPLPAGRTFDDTIHAGVYTVATSGTATPPSSWVVNVSDVDESNVTPGTGLGYGEQVVTADVAVGGSLGMTPWRVLALIAVALAALEFVLARRGKLS
jgi:hypothetical protein